MTRPLSECCRFASMDAFRGSRAGAGCPMTQKDKRKVCNTEADDNKGDERKAFMSECLKADKKM